MTIRTAFAAPAQFGTSVPSYTRNTLGSPRRIRATLSTESTDTVERGAVELFVAVWTQGMFGL